MAYDRVILVGFTKSAIMMLNHARYLPNVLVDAICPMFDGTLSTMPDIMRRYLKWFYPFIGWILTEHIVDEDISVCSDYLENADYSQLDSRQITVVMSSLDKKIKHTKKEFWHPANLFFLLTSPIMEKAIKENRPDNTGYRSSYKTQFPPFEVSNLITVYGSMPTTLNHPKVRALIKRQIKEQNEKRFQTN